MSEHGGNKAAVAAGTRSVGGRLLEAPGMRAWVVGCVLVAGVVVGMAVVKAVLAAWRPATYQAYRWERPRLDGWYETITYAIRADRGSERVILVDSNAFVNSGYINWLTFPSWPSVYSYDVESRELQSQFIFATAWSSSTWSNRFDVMRIKVGAYRPWMELDYAVGGLGGGYVPPMPSFSVAPATLIKDWRAPTVCVVRWRTVAIELLGPVGLWTVVYLGLRCLVLWRRSRRGLCWRCAYPTPTGARCSECGSMA